VTKITRITTQKRSKHRYNIFIDDNQGEQYGFSVDEDILIEFGLRKGLELDEAMMRKLVQQDSIHKSYDQAIRYLGYRMRTEKEIRDYLLKKEVDREHITEIMNKLSSRKLLNDKEFAIAFVNTRIQTTTKGPGLVEKELMQKGVTQQIARQAVEQYTYGIQYEKAMKVAEKKIRQSSKHSFNKQLDQMQSTLIRNGFTRDVINDVRSEYREETDQDAELEALQHHGERLLRRYQGKYDDYELRNKLKEGLYRQGFSIGMIEDALPSLIGQT